MSTDMVLPSQVDSHYESIQPHNELHIVQWNSVAIRCQSQLCLHALGGCPLEWWCCQMSAVYAMHRQFCAHNDCHYNSVLIKNCQFPHHQFHTQWMFSKSPVSVVSPFQAQWLSTESPVSVISPVSHTLWLNVQWITSLCSHQFKAHWMSTKSPASCVSPVWSTMNVHRITPVSCTMNVSWDGVAIRITCLLCLTSFKPSVCPLEWCCYQEHVSPCLSVTMTPFMYTVNVPRHSVAIRDQSVTAQYQFHAYSNVRWMVLPGWITKALPPLIHNVSHTHTPSVQWEMVLPSKVTNHSYVLSTVHFCTQW